MVNWMVDQTTEDIPRERERRRGREAQRANIYIHIYTYNCTSYILTFLSQRLISSVIYTTASKNKSLYDYDCTPQKKRKKTYGMRATIWP